MSYELWELVMAQYSKPTFKGSSMKIILLLITIGIGINVNAQYDGFLRYQYEYREEDDEWNKLIVLPDKHGLDYNYPADNAPVGMGLLLMSGMGLVYANYRKRK